MKFTYRVVDILASDFTTETLNCCFLTGETLVAIVPTKTWGDQPLIKVVTMKRELVQENPVPVFGEVNVNQSN